MIIEIAVENENTAYLDINSGNFPFVIVFKGRLKSDPIIRANLDLDALKGLIKSINSNVDVEKLLKEATIK